MTHHLLRPAPRWLRLALFPVSLLALGALALWSVRPPAPLPADAPAEEFSAGRALEHVRALAAEPRPVGSPVHARAREYLVSELEELGLEVEVHRDTVGYHHPRTGPRARIATVHNVLALLPGKSPDETEKKGPASGGPVLGLMAHYDSVPQAPGAADDASGLAVILETLRALRHEARGRGTPPAHDLLVVITDAEEVGLMGAQALFRPPGEGSPGEADGEKAEGGDETSPGSLLEVVARLALVLNFEARGTRGPVFMFETSPGNGELLELLGRAAPYPLANSLTYGIYRRLPNDTDLTLTKAAGIRGLNFAFNDGYYDYHTVGDSTENLDPASVQHAGSYALGVARHLLFPPPEARRAPGLGDLVGTEDPGDATYFNPLGFRLVRYPVELTPWLSLLTLALLATVLAGSLRRGLRAGDLLRGSTAFVLQAVLALSAVAGAGAWLWGTAGTEGVRFRALLAQGDALLWGLALLMAAVSLTAYGAFATGLPLPLMRRPVPVPALALGSLAGWGLLLAAVTVVLPDGAYLLTWPLLAVLAAHEVALRPGGALSEPTTTGRLLMLTAGAVPGILWLVLLTRLLFVALGVAQPALALAPAALLAGLVVPAAMASVRASRGLLPAACLVAALVLLALVATRDPFGPRHPRPVEAFYWLDADTGIPTAAAEVPAAEVPEEAPETDPAPTPGTAMETGTEPQDGAPRQAGTARWVSVETGGEGRETQGGSPVAWIDELLGPEPETATLGRVLPGSERAVRLGPAQLEAGQEELPVPRLEVLRMVTTDDVLVWHLQLTTARGAGKTGGAETVVLSVPRDRVRSLTWGGHDMPLEGTGEWARAWWFGYPPKGAEIVLETPGRAGAELEIHLATLTHRWPEALRDRLERRPPDLMPDPRSLADDAVVTRSFRLAPPPPDRATAEAGDIGP